VKGWQIAAFLGLASALSAELVCCGTGISDKPYCPPAAFQLTFVGLANLGSTFGHWDGADNGIENLWVVDSAGLSPKALTQNTSGGVPFTPAYSPDGSWIYFQSQQGVATTTTGWNLPSTTNNIWRISADGTSMTALTRNTGAENSIRVNPSVDGKTLVFVSTQSLATTSGAFNQGPINPQNMWIMDADGTNLRPLTQHTTAAVFSRDGLFIPGTSDLVFLSTQALSTTPVSWNAAPILPLNVWRMAVNGSTLNALTQNTVGSNTIQGLTLSPDGAHVAFFATMGLTTNSTTWDQAAVGCNNIWIMDADGSNLHALTQNTLGGLDSKNPQFIDSTHLTFESFQGFGTTPSTWDQPSSGEDNIWTMTTSGSALTALTQNTTTGFSDQPYGSPDGQWIFFRSDMGLSTKPGAWNQTSIAENLWRMDLDGTHLVPLTQKTLSSPAAELDDIRFISFRPPRCQ
jgi:hypothetical protein